MSEAVKSLLASLSVKVILAVSPALNAVLSVVIARVGGVVSLGTVLVAIVTVLLLSAPSALTLPAASENFRLATLITLLTVLLGVGVKTAV